MEEVLLFRWIIVVILVVIMAVYYITPIIKEYKSTHDQQAYQTKNMLEGIDNKPESERRY